MTNPLPDTPQNLRNFGFGASAILLFLSILSWRKGSAPFPFLLGTALLFAACAALAPTTLRSVFRGWMKVAGNIAAVNSFLLLGLVYYLMITPYSLLQRVMGSDILGLKFEKDSPSYWKDHPGGKDRETYERLF